MAGTKRSPGKIAVETANKLSEQVKMAMTKCTGDKFDLALQAVKKSDELCSFLNELFCDDKCADDPNKKDLGKCGCEGADPL